MDARELRMGNYIALDVDKSVHKISYISPGTEWLFWVEEPDGSVNSFIKESDSEGVPLTEEWLEKFGFKDSIGFYIKPGFVLNRGFAYELVHGAIKIEFVHQLQNLHFALTSEELTIKD